MGKITREYVSITFTSRIFGMEALMTVAPRFSACIIFGLFAPSKKSEKKTYYNRWVIWKSLFNFTLYSYMVEVPQGGSVSTTLNETTVLTTL